MHTALYVSSFAERVPVSAVADIAKVSRKQNLAANITGLLVFDGSAFAQLLEGPDDAVAALVARLPADERHTDFQLLSIGPTQGPRRFPTWQLGYLLLDSDGPGIERLRRVGGAEALVMFDAMLPTLDVEIGSALPSRTGSSPQGN